MMIKKLLISTLFSLLFAFPSFSADFAIYRDDSGFISTLKISGATTNSYPSTANCVWKSAYLTNSKSIFIYNTGSDSLKFKILAYPTLQTGVDPYIMKDSLGTPQSDIVVTSGNVAVVNLMDDKVQEIDISVKSAATDTPTTYTCIATGAKIR